jgi:hypothetical protein
MAITLSNVNIGSGPGAGNGDPLRTAFTTINNNFALVQANLNNPSGATSVSALANNGFQLQLDSTGNTLVPKNLTVAGNLIVIGNVTVVNQEIINSSEIVAGNLTANNITLSGNVTGNVNGYAIGYRDVPQITAANLTLIASDAGKHYYGSNTNPTTITIPTNANVAFGNGTAISLVNQGTGNITITPTSGVLLYLAGNTTAGSRTLTTYGMATLLKVQVNTWFINGTGVV